jgi:hypothetical protein
MATTSSAGTKSVGTIDVQTPTPRTVVVNVVSDELRLTDWAVFWTVAECSEATIHEVRS